MGLLLFIPGLIFRRQPVKLNAEALKSLRAQSFI
jgi:hypothetical protein